MPGSLKLIWIGASLAASMALGWIGPRFVQPSKAVDQFAAFSRTGRDRALVVLLHEAKKTIFIRTEALDVLAVGNELGLAQQRGVQVRIEMPLSDAQTSRENQVIGQHLLDLGSIVSWSSEPISSFEGTYVLVDDSKFLYSASSIRLAVPGAPRSYVVGQVRQGS
jgi:phosphatidylserine/phosphatidylglycerophosphate/cardiolipin synthase-like enzyme